MSRRIPRYGLRLLLFALATAPACDNASSDVSTTFTGPANVPTQVVVNAEPATLRPEFLPGFDCGAAGAFGTRVIVVVSGGASVSVRSLGFRFTDRSGIVAVPHIRLIQGTSPMTVPASSMIPPQAQTIPPLGVFQLPTSSPIPIPQPQSMPFFLTFGCGVAADGILVITVDAVDGRGTLGTTRTQVRVGI